jgi:transketolase
MNLESLSQLAKLVRYYILLATTRAASGHPTSSLSAVELMVSLFFGGILRTDLERPDFPNNDRVIFSKGHASALLYALYAVAGVLQEEELLSYRRFGSPLEGHPTPRFPYVDAATGSLGQGLSVGLGIALNGKYLDRLPYRTYVLLGDGELAEGSCWEAMEVASHYQLDNLVGILDVNRLGQRGPTMLGWDLETYRARIASFGWQTVLVEDGNDLDQAMNAYGPVGREGKPTMIIARTVKGKGVSWIEDQVGWHGKPLNDADFQRAVVELGTVDHTLRGTIPLPQDCQPASYQPAATVLPEEPDKPLSTRQAYGQALVKIFPRFPQMVVLDAEVSNSTFSQIFQQAYPDRFFEMFITEQNMVSVALGLSACGKLPFLSSFGAFLSRAADQLRMAQYALQKNNLKCAGSHVGVSIGADGPSQMALEDLALFRAIGGSVVLYPADRISTERLVEAAAQHHGLVYLRTTRGETAPLYPTDEDFPIGGSKTLRAGDRDLFTIVSAGITLYEALAACSQLREEGICVRVIDLYSIKPLDIATLERAARETEGILTVEDHHPEGGLGEAVASALSGFGVPVVSLAVRKTPMSGQPDELLKYEEISREAIVAKIKQMQANYC